MGISVFVGMGEAVLVLVGTGKSVEVGLGVTTVVAGISVIRAGAAWL
jgi:hypothetical protein